MFPVIRLGPELVTPCELTMVKFWAAPRETACAFALVEAANKPETASAEAMSAFDFSERLLR